MYQVIRVNLLEFIQDSISLRRSSYRALRPQHREFEQPTQEQSRPFCDFKHRSRDTQARISFFGHAGFCFLKPRIPPSFYGHAGF